LKLQSAGGRGGQPFPGEEVVIVRGKQGVPHIRAARLEDAFYGLGFMHCYDRMFQMWFMKLLAMGRLSEHLGARTELIGLDRHFKKLHFWRPYPGEEDELPAQVRGWLDGYVAGANAFRDTGYRPLELVLTGIKPEPWLAADVLALGRLTGYVGLADSQSSLELLILGSLLENPSRFESFRRLYEPYLEGYDPAWYEGLKMESPLASPKRGRSAGGSNNWAVSGKLTRGGGPIFCSDPHLEVSRLPAIWYEAFLDTPTLQLGGGTMPGMPCFFSAWNGKLAWGATYSCAATEDLFVEECRGGMYRKDGAYHPFRERVESLTPKGGREVRFVFHENDHGVLEGDPKIDGRYLVRRWSGGQKGSTASSLEAMMRLCLAQTVAEAVTLIRGVSGTAQNWVLADAEGSISFQMSGLIPLRGQGLSGLLPLPGWDSRYDWQGWIASEHLPHCVNPPENYVVTANNRLDGSCRPAVQTMPFPSDRADRIARLLREGGPLDAQAMKAIQLDVRSPQADRVLEFLKPHLEGHSLGRRLLAWDRRFDTGSREAVLFDLFYRELMIAACDGVLFERRQAREIYDRTLFFVVNGQAIERQWQDPRGIFRDKDWGALGAEVLAGLEGKPLPRWGKWNSLRMRHLLLGRTLLGPLFNAGPFRFRGSFSTVHQGTKFDREVRDEVFGPSYRLVVDFAQRKCYSALPGGASGRRLSRFYKAGIRQWLEGVYREGWLKQLP